MLGLTESAAIIQGTSSLGGLRGAVQPVLAYWLGFHSELWLAVFLLAMLGVLFLIWMIAKLVSGLFGLLTEGSRESESIEQPADRCSECRLGLAAGGGECPRCGAGGPKSFAPPARALDRWLRNLLLLEDRGILPADVAHRLRVALESELRALHVAPSAVPSQSATRPVATSPSTAQPSSPTVPGSIHLTAPGTVLDSLPGSTSFTTPTPGPRDTRAKDLSKELPKDLSSEPPSGQQVSPPAAHRKPATGSTSPKSLKADSSSLSQPQPTHAPKEEPLWLEVVDSEPKTGAKSPVTRAATHRRRTAGLSPKGESSTTAAPPASPRIDWSDWLLTFMEQRNLNWGELIGGLMILSGSLALVFSFWNQIAERPLLKFCVFNGFTAGLFAAGRYALSRLQLPSTARALYAIGTLLVPLNLLAMAAISRDGATASPLLFVGELLSAGLFAGLLYRAGGVLSPADPARFTWGVLGPAAASLLIARLDLAHGPAWLSLAVGLWPVALYLAANLWRLSSAGLLPASRAEPGPLTSSPTGSSHVADAASQTLDQPASAWWRLATTSFATLLPLGLLLTRGTGAQARSLAPLLPLLAAPSLGLALAYSGTKSSLRSGLTRLLAGLAGLPALALIAGGLLLSWPSVWPCLLTIASVTAVLTWLSARERAPALWLLALPGVLLGWMLVLGLLRGQVDWQTTDPDLLGDVLLHPWNSIALLPLVGLLFAGSRSRRAVELSQARWMQLGGGLIALFSLLHTCGTSLNRDGDPGFGSLVLLLYGMLSWLAAEMLADQLPAPAASLPVAEPLPPARNERGGTTVPSHDRTSPQSREPGQSHWAPLAVGVLSVLLLVAASWQLAMFRFPSLLPPHGPLVPLLAAGLLLIAPPWRRAKSTTAQTPSPRGELDRLRAVCVSGMAGLAVLIGFFAWVSGTRQWLPLQGLACAGAWFAIAWRQRRTNWSGGTWFGAAQILTAVSTGLAITQYLTDRDWAGRIQPELFDPLVWQWGGAAASLQCLLWLGLRWWVTRQEDPAANSRHPASLRGDLATLLHAPGALGDRWLVPGLTGMLLLWASYAVLPGAARELTPRQQANSWTPASAIPVVTPAPASESASVGTSVPEVATTEPVIPRVVPPLSVYEIRGIPHSRATGRGMWCWWGALVLVRLAWHWRAPSRLHSGLLLLTLTAAAPLCAVSWEGEVASASALRWFLTAGIVGTAAVAWSTSFRRANASAPTSLFDRCVSPFAEEWVLLAMLFKLGCLIGFALIVGTLVTTPQSAPLISGGDLRLCLAVAAAGLVLGLLIHLGVFHALSAEVGTPLTSEAGTLGAAPGTTERLVGQSRSSTNSATMALTAPAINHSASSQSATSHSAWAGLVWLLGLGPLLVVMLFGVAQALRGNPLLGPEPGSLFHSLGLALNHAIPLTVWGLVLAGQAYRFRRTTPLFLSGLLFQSATTLAVLFTATRAGRTLDAALWSEVLCWNSLVASLLTGLWWWQRERLEGSATTDLLPGNQRLSRPSALLLFQTRLGPILWGLTLIPALLELWVSHHWGPASASIAGGLGTISFGAALLALWMWARSDESGNLWAAWRTCLAGGCAVWLGTQIGRLDPAWLAPVNHWQVLALLLTLGTVALWLTQWQQSKSAAARMGTDHPRHLSEVITLGTLAGFASLWNGELDCAWPNTSVALVLGGLCLVHGAWRGARSWSWGAVGLWCLGQVLFETFAQRVPVVELLLEARPWSLPTRMLLLAAIPATISVAIRPRSHSGGLAPDGRLSGLTSLLPDPARIVGSLGLLLVVANIGMEFAWWRNVETDVTAFTRLALPIALLAVWGATLFDGTRMRSIPQIYLSAWGIAWVFATQGYSSLALMGDRLLSAQAVLSGCCGLLWLRRRDLGLVAQWLGVNPSSRNVEVNRYWLRRATGFVSLAVLLLAFFRVNDRSFQNGPTLESLFTLGLPVVALIPVGLLALLCRPSNDLWLRGQILRRGAWGVIFAGWAVAGTSGLLSVSGHYTLWWSILLLAVTVYQAGLVIAARYCPEEWAEWKVAIGRLLRWLPGLSLVLHLLMVALHPSVSEPWGLASVWGMALLLLSLLLMAVGTMTIAVRADLSPAPLTDGQRRRLVFLCEAFLALVFWQLRNLFPDLFQRFAAYWPVTVMGLSFAGLGIAEYCRRRNQPILAEPLQQTALALPLLPLLGSWLSPSAGASGVALLLGGLLYGVLSQRRGSLWLAFAALVTTTGAIWIPLAELDACSPWRHPQLWLIPPALGLLLAGWLHREQLTAEQAGLLRYIGAITIYLSSTFDIFLNGLAKEPWLVLVLCGLSIAGMLLGMLMRVRGFLFLGLGFLLLSLTSMVWHAAVNLHQTWTVWLAVVLLGVAVLALFALFERRRAQVQTLLRDLRDWSV